MLKNLNSRWDLDAYFPGGSESEAFHAYLAKLKKDLQDFRLILAQTPHSDDPLIWQTQFETVQDLAKRLRHAQSFVSCLSAQNTQDHKARQLSGEINTLSALNDSMMSAIEERLLQLTTDQFDALLATDYFQPLSFNLKEIRHRALDKLSKTEETLINDLSTDGYHAWNTLYNTVSGALKIPVEIDGQSLILSPGQAANMMSSPNRTTRCIVFKAWEDAWSSVAETCALAINEIAGFRLQVYNHRQWADVLQEPLENNRMTRKTLDIMWETINRNKPALVQFLERQKQLLGTDQLSWHDYTAPMGQSNKTYTLDEAANFVVKHVSSFGQSMGDLVTKAFTNNWVETENRDNKRAGAFCSSSPVEKQSRVFMTFSGSTRNISTMAHELGHAYHQSVMNELAPISQRYAMNVAETASTFSELVVSAATLAAAESEEERIALLSANLQRAVSLLMNIQSRFLFETRFYERRREGYVSVPELNQLMVDAQKEAFCDSLDEYHPHFWASKLHFYSTRTPFYNFPYTFGYLFSAGVYARALAEGTAFEAKYQSLLRDTGRMRVEDLARKHLGVDIESAEFWQDAIDNVLSGLPEFLKLTN